MANPFRLADAADVYDPSIQKMFLKHSELDERNFEKFYNVETGVEDYVRKDSSLTGLGEAARVEPENAAITSESPVQGYDKTYTQVEFGKVLSFTKKMWKFGIKKRDMTQITRELMMACVRKRERLCAEHLENGHSTSYTHTDDAGNYSVTVSGGDAVAMFSAAHTREDGGTNWNNIVYDGTTYNMDFEYDAVKAAHRTASLIRDGKGNLMNLMLDTFVFARGSGPYFRAMEILGAIRKGEIAGSADNDGAGVPAFKMLVLPYLATLTRWYAFDSSRKSEVFGPQYLESQAIQLEGPNLVFKTNEIQYKSTMMFDLGHNDARNWVGSNASNTL